jgi:hypothetical protein
MNMAVDPVIALESLGYTEREAAFLYLVAVHSGYFLRRQFNYFIDRQKGYLAHHFIEKARVCGHIEIIDYGQGRFVYHLFSKPIYGLIGNSESQNRRRKGDSQIRTRLMALDYVLENRGDHYFETEIAKLDFFVRVRGISPNVFTDKHERLHPFLGTHPVSVMDLSHAATSIVRFPFMDEGLISIRKFSRFLTELVPLFNAIGAFEVIYAATSDCNFAAAEAMFRRVFSSHMAGSRQILGDFRAQSQVAQGKNRLSLHGKFTRLLLQSSYPNLLRNEPRGSVAWSGPGSQKRRATA